MPIRSRGLKWLVALALVAIALPRPAFAGKVSWLDDVVQEVVQEARAGGKLAVEGASGPQTARAAGRFFARDADESLEVLARRYDDLARAGRSIDEPAEALLDARFSRLVRAEPDMARTFKSLKPAEKRLVVAMGETAERLALRYPGEAETMIRKLGPEGLAAVRVYGDDVAEIIAKEGPETVGILRKTGRSGWSFFTGTVLPHKKKLIAAGVLAAFLANPDKFVDYAGKATEYAVREFARAGVQLTSAIGAGASRGLESAVSETLASYGLTSTAARYVGMGLAIFVATLAAMIVLGIPVAWIFRPVVWLVRLPFGRRRAAAKAA